MALSTGDPKNKSTVRTKTITPPKGSTESTSATNTTPAADANINGDPSGEGYGVTTPEDDPGGNSIIGFENAGKSGGVKDKREAGARSAAKKAPAKEGAKKARRR